MKILRALGLGLVIVIFQLFVPRLFHGFEDTLVAIFNTAQVLISVSGNTIKSGPFPLLPSSDSVHQ